MDIEENHQIELKMMKILGIDNRIIEFFVKHNIFLLWFNNLYLSKHSISHAKTILSSKDEEIISSAFQWGSAKYNGSTQWYDYHLNLFYYLKNPAL